MHQVLPALTWGRFLGAGRFDPVTGPLIVALGAAYGAGVLRLRRRGERWPAARSVVFALFGLGMIWLGTMSALAVYGRVLFWPAAVQNVVLDLFAPFGLALGDPIALARRALTARAGSRLDRLLRSLPLRVLTFPLVSSAAVLATELGIYFTPYFEHALRNQALRELMYLHLLAAGSLFVFPVLTGAEILPAWCGYPVRAFLVFVDGLLDAGVVVMLSGTRIAGSWYAAQPRNWGPTPQWDQRLGGGAMITLTELVGLPFLLAVFVQWYRDERGRTIALDARLDAELQRPADPGVSANVGAELLRPWWETDTGPVGERMRRVDP